MKRTYTFMAALLISLMIIGIATVRPAAAWMDEDSRPFHQWLWEGHHATMINALLISAHDQILKHHERYVILAKEYSERDPLLKVYGLREVCDDSVKDAFLAGLKANNLIYLIHVADDNPMAKKWAIKDLRLLGQAVKSLVVMREFPYWADLLEEGRYPSRRLSHIYVHYTIDIGDYYYERMGVNTRFYFWLGYLINDFTVANLCDNQDWLKEDQRYLTLLYADRRMDFIPRFTLHDWWKVTTADLTLRDAIDKTQACLDTIKAKYLDREMGNK